MYTPTLENIQGGEQWSLSKYTAPMRLVRYSGDYFYGGRASPFGFGRRRGERESKVGLWRPPPWPPLLPSFCSAQWKQNTISSLYSKACSFLKHMKYSSNSNSAAILECEKSGLQQLLWYCIP